MKTSIYKSALSYLESFTNYEKVRSYEYNERYFDLSRVLNILLHFDNPQEKFSSIHIAGTKGKGSVSVMCAYILANAGYKVGLYQSPHLVCFRERIKILSRDKTLSVKEKMISEKEVVNLTHKIKNIVDKLFPPLTLQSFAPTLLPTTFELCTVLAFIYFAHQKIDIGVIEVGLGGRLDATNVIKSLVSVITTIGYDHTKELGSTLPKIAREKCGIIKDNNFVISSPQRTSALKIIKKTCKEKNAKLYITGRDLKFYRRKINCLYENFDVDGILKKYKNVRLSILGEHQIINATTAIGAIELLKLRDKNYKISDDAIFQGLKNAKLQGRIQVLSLKPVIILDGAHNALSAEVLVKTIKEKFKFKKAIFIVSIFSDKDIKKFFSKISLIADRIILTKLPYGRFAKPDQILKLVPKENIIVIENFKQAISYAKNTSSKDDLICITGSLYLAGEVLKGDI